MNQLFVENAHIKKEANKSLDSLAAVQLLEFMGELSEEFWCAGWMCGLEYALWEAITTEYYKMYEYGLSKITKEMKDKLKELSDKSGGWWFYDGNKEYGQNETFLTVDKWVKKYES